MIDEKILIQHIDELTAKEHGAGHHITAATLLSMRKFIETYAEQNEAHAAPVRRSEYLDAAFEIVCKDREQQYGSPENNFDAIARLWTEYLVITYGESNVISARDVAIMMALLKIARIATGKQKSDSWVDAIGYMACGAEIASGN